LQLNGTAHELKIRGVESANQSLEALLADRCQLISHGFALLAIQCHVCLAGIQALDIAG
jgi:hypothetical protein